MFPGDLSRDKICVTDLNEILFKSMPNRWRNKAYVKGFDRKSIIFKEAVNMFECMEIS